MSIMQTRYRVQAKYIYDGVNSEPQVARYHYDEAATNDSAHSTAIANTELIPRELRFTPAFSEFRGHAVFQEIAPTGATTTSFYSQDDAKKGRVQRQQVGTQSVWDGFERQDGSLWSFTHNSYSNWQAETTPYHGDGAAGSEVWQSSGNGCGTHCTLTYGPYQTPSAVGAGQRAITRLALDDNNLSTGTDLVGWLDVYDSTTATVLAQRNLYRYEFGVGGLSNFKEFALEFDTTGLDTHLLEYRLFVMGSIVMAHDWTQVEWNHDSGHIQKTARLHGDHALYAVAPETQWTTLSRQQASLTDGEMARIQFYVPSELASGGNNPLSTGVLGVESGVWGTASYRRLALKISGDQLMGESYVGTSSSNSTLMPLNKNRWYVLQIGIEDGGDSQLLVWERDVADGGYLHVGYDATFNFPVASHWKFFQQVSGGAMWLDSYQEIVNYSETVTRYRVEAGRTIDESQMPHKVNWSVPWPLYEGVYAYWVTPQYQFNLSYEGDVSPNLTRQQMEYDALTGNPTAVTDAQADPGVAGGWRHLRTQYTAYASNSANQYLTGLPIWQNVYECDATACPAYSAADKLLSSEQYLYDNHEAYNTAPTHGVLTGKRTLLRWANAANHADPRYNDERYEYDGWGNQTIVKLYENEGLDNQAPSGTPRTVTTIFDGNYHSYPVSVQGPLLPATTLDYNWTLGLPISETVTVGSGVTATTTGDYDPFGRLIEIRRPGDESGAPTVGIAYFDSYPGSYGVPFMINIQQKLNGSQLPHIRRFYNGLGELIQEQQARSLLATGFKDVVVDSRVQPFEGGAGTEQLQSVPYEIYNWQSSGSPDPTPWRGQDFTQPLTQTILDVAGRPVAVTGTDGQVQQTTSYFRDRVETRDADSNLTTSYMDVWGQVSSVVPALGPSTSYTYDAKGQLTATNYGGAISAIQYDLAGRKVWMDDADMGVWTYQYNALGELKRQTDARNKTVCFYYDQLGRMTGKHYATTTSCPTSPTLNVSYGYDDILNGNLGYGQRTSMTDSSGSTSWRYDVRGRVVEEVRNVTGVSGSFKSAWAYNSADMVKGIYYPDGNSGNTGEAVATTYLAQGSVFSVYGSIAYASNSKYDAAGRLLTQERKSKTQKLTQSYFDWATVGGVGRLQTIQAGTSASPASYLGLAYTYDPLGNVATAQETTNSSQVQHYSYDDLNRLTAAWTTGLGSGQYNETYSYNATTGNLATKAGYTHSYADTNHPHAVTQATNGTLTNSYEY
ncbi:MAG: RHS repeat protein, partial [Anaerolineales bacterium]|nr:RHS repeat protein [Anaerolineales bacterium]